MFQRRQLVGSPLDKVQAVSVAGHIAPYIIRGQGKFEIFPRRQRDMVMLIQLWPPTPSRVARRRDGERSGSSKNNSARLYVIGPMTSTPGGLGLPLSMRVAPEVRIYWSNFYVSAVLTAVLFSSLMKNFRISYPMSFFIIQIGI